MIKKTAADLEKVIERAQKVRTLKNHSGWLVVEDILQEGIRNCRNRVMNEDCEIEEVRMIRSVVTWLNKLVNTPNITDEQFAKWQGEVAFRRQNEKMREELGMVPNPEDPRHEEFRQGQGR